MQPLIRDIFAARRTEGKPVVSFELFPPKTEAGERDLLEKTLPELLQMEPDFCSVTYGAGGGTQDKTLRIVEHIIRQYNLPTLAHLTCVNATRDQIQGVVGQLRGIGVNNILALRGDPTGNQGEFTRPEGGFEFAHQLVSLLRETSEISVGVAGFPEGHPACKVGRQVDWDFLKAKIDCGADFVLTQLFFDNRHYFAMRDHLQKQGVNVPLVPGIIPILSAGQIKKFTALCGAELPAKLQADLECLETDEQAAAMYGIDYATRQCQELLDAGAPGIHFYCLNKARSCRLILSNLGLR
jgi:methylenetetrahydrofolate reductase (NADPH)